MGTWERERLKLTLKCRVSTIDGPGALTGRGALEDGRVELGKDNEFDCFIY